MSILTIVDTDILIDVGREVPEAVECLAHIEEHSVPAVSIISQMELFVGCRDKTEQRRTERFLAGFYVVKLTEQASDVAINLLRQYRLRYGLAIPDALIAATAIAMNQPLVSKNQRDYRFIKGLQLLPYPQPNKL
ncbi:MAG: type II toxin-antitoxin system VapC family toxin [Planctomycetes bacterium]|nr:type II toxin-antitoxin system VapC family toxin [Planctomycetota bacterium]